MNEYILLVMKWLGDPESVSQEEMGKNKEDAYFSYAASSPDSVCFSTCFSADRAASYAAINDSDGAKYWVNDYFKASDEDKQAYLDKLKQQ